VSEFILSVIQIIETDSALPRNYSMRKPNLSRWIFVAWYGWCAVLTAMLAYFFFW